MGIVIPNAYALALAATEDANHPIIGYDNVVTVDTVTADQADTDYPATNLASPSTAELWKSGSTAAQKVTVLFDAATVDYIGLARHNLGSGLCPVTIQGLPPSGNAGTDGDWVELVAQQLLADDSPVIFRFTPGIYKGLRLKLVPASVQPQAAVLYCGALLVFERGVQVGFTPINYGRQPNVVNLRSQGGDFLGRIVLGGTLVTSATIIDLSPDWYRSTLDPFFAASATTPFFWAWSPQDYPAEVGFAWLTSDPMPVVSQLPGYINVALQMEGIRS